MARATARARGDHSLQGSISTMCYENVHCFGKPRRSTAHQCCGAILRDRGRMSMYDRIIVTIEVAVTVMFMIMLAFDVSDSVAPT